MSFSFLFGYALEAPPGPDLTRALAKRSFTLLSFAGVSCSTIWFKKSKVKQLRKIQGTRIGFYMAETQICRNNISFCGLNFLIFRSQNHGQNFYQLNRRSRMINVRLIENFIAFGNGDNRTFRPRFPQFITNRQRVPADSAFGRRIRR